MRDGLMAMILFSLLFFLTILGVMGGLVFWQIKKTDPKNTDTSLKDDITTAQEFLPFKDISDSMINLGNHQYRALIEVSSINYNLKTKKEKDILELSFQRFLNSLDFPYSIFIQTKTMDNTKMITLLEKDINKVLEEFPQLEEYARIHLQDMANIQDRIQTTKQKKKYIIVPYDDANQLTNLDDNEKYVEAAKELYNRCQLVIDGLETMGLRGKILTTNEIAEVVTSVYHRHNYRHVEGLADGDYLETFVLGENKMANVLSEGKLDLILVEAKTKLQTELLENRDTDPRVLESARKAIMELERIRDNLAGFYKSNIDLEQRGI